jgi:membrane associated rhomboid family serine protease
MSGNALEEWLMTRLDHPSHLDPTRIGGLAGLAAGFFTGLILFAFLGPVAGVVGGFVVAVVLGSLVAKRLAQQSEAKRSAAMIAKRAAQVREQERMIAAMKREEAE